MNREPTTEGNYQWRMGMYAAFTIAIDFTSRWEDKGSRQLSIIYLHFGSHQYQIIGTANRLTVKINWDFVPC